MFTVFLTMSNFFNSHNPFCHLCCKQKQNAQTQSFLSASITLTVPIYKLKNRFLCNQGDLVHLASPHVQGRKSSCIFMHNQITNGLYIYVGSDSNQWPSNRTFQDAFAPSCPVILVLEII